MKILLPGGAATVSPPAPNTVLFCDNDPTAWLSIGGRGCRHDVLQITQAAPASRASVTIHPQAQPILCHHVLETLISLAKTFPDCLLQQTPATASIPICIDQETDKSKESAVPKTPNSTKVEPAHDFWELIVRLNYSAGKKTGSSPQIQLPIQDTSNGATPFDGSPVCQLMRMLAHPVVTCSKVLTDRLLTLLGLVSIQLSTLTPSSGVGTPDQLQQQQIPIISQPPAVVSAQPGM